MEILLVVWRGPQRCFGFPEVCLTFNTKQHNRPSTFLTTTSTPTDNTLSVSRCNTLSRPFKNAGLIPIFAAAAAADPIRSRSPADGRATTQEAAMARIRCPQPSTQLHTRFVLPKIHGTVGTNSKRLRARIWYISGPRTTCICSSNPRPNNKRFKSRTFANSCA